MFNNRWSTNLESLNLPKCHSLWLNKQEMRFQELFMKTLPVMDVDWKELWELDTNVLSATIMIFAKDVKLPQIILILSLKFGILARLLLKSLLLWMMSRRNLFTLMEEGTLCADLEIWFIMDWILLSNLWNKTLKLLRNRKRKRHQKNKRKKKKFSPNLLQLLNLQLIRKLAKKLSNSQRGKLKLVWLKSQWKKWWVKQGNKSK